MSRAIDPEIAAYEAIRQRLRAFATLYPWVLDITLTDEDFACVQCKQKTTIQHPEDTFRCTACGHRWTRTPRRGGVR